MQVRLYLAETFHIAHPLRNEYISKAYVALIDDWEEKIFEGETRATYNRIFSYAQSTIS